ncbi:P-loop containing nucleoside triphosphate hydrolase protein [Cantharellus anzutake]|uniref:P-loop containing nucleoside triphosphate hydrolase protein n=1 Tax=Cantharellus anzutake TaxID=1750568 RepID=UPI001906F9D7|nr:P-loop containing nucleoside triphosphate hydrolase protein [Cantharellus anzutake]KAF8333070.1 P-loop containing nucleoside triphosphate hydrolase protein [Cantharellus anzutake]
MMPEERLDVSQSPRLRDRPARRPSPLEAPSIRASIARSYTPSPPLTASSQRSSTSRPHLFFALASDSPNQVEKLLSSGKANANDTAGPQDLPALVFSLTNDQLLNKTEIVKTLLAHGADPSAVEHLVPHDSSDEESKDLEESPLAGQIRIALNPAIGYYIGRPNAVTQGQREALQAGQYEPLLQARFYLIGQDLVLQEMTRAVASHSKRKKESASLSLVLVGPSGHGKSYFASKIGSLLKSPQYIVNMTNLRTQEDLLQAKSLASESDVSFDSDNLQHFLARHEGSRCVVILEEIEKTADKQVLHALLMPWELGKLPASPQLVFNTSPVIWVCTSNAGEELVFECHHAKDMTTKSAREEYLKLMARMRSRLADEIGASIVSRVNAVLPFLPFTVDEQRALASETLSELIAREEVRPEWLNTGASDELVESAIAEYMEREGARSIHRAVQMRFEEGMCND